MADENSSLRLSTPSHQMYDTTVGEASLLRGITPENIGGLYGLLLNQRALGASARGEYNDQLRAVNNQQFRLNEAKLRADELKSLREAAIAAVDKGHASLGNMAPLRNLFIDPQALAATDATRQAGLQAKVVNDLAGSAEHLSSSGLLQPGQRVDLTPGGLVAAGSGTAGPSRALQVAQEGSRGQITAAGLRASGEGRPVYEETGGTLPGDRQWRIRGTNPASVSAAAAARSNTPPAAGSGGTPPPAGSTPPPTSTSGVRTFDQAKEAARQLGLPAGTRYSATPDGSWTAILPDGRRQALR